MDWTPVKCRLDFARIWLEFKINVGKNYVNLIVLRVRKKLINGHLGAIAGKNKQNKWTNSKKG